MPRTDLLSAIVLILFGGFVAVESWRMPRFERIGGTIQSAPGLVPGLLGIIIALLGAIMLVRYLLARGKKPSAAAAMEMAADSVAPLTPAPSELGEFEVAVGEGLEQPSEGRMLVALVLSVVFAAGLVGRLPFWLATFLFVFAFIGVFERHTYTSARAATFRLAIAAAIAGATAFAVPFVFERIFLVNLP